MSDALVPPERLASALAARLIHDAMGPASGIVSAFDLIADPTLADMRDEALALAQDSARKLVGLLSLSRVIYGGGVVVSAEELSAFAAQLFEGSRAQLGLRIDKTIPVTVASARVFLGLLQIVATAASAGGVVEAAHTALPNDDILVAMEGRGSRVRLAEEVRDGLNGRPFASGLAHRWSAAYLIGSIARSCGGDVQIVEVEGGMSFRAIIRADIA